MRGIGVGAGGRGLRQDYRRQKKNNGGQGNTRAFHVGILSASVRRQTKLLFGVTGPVRPLRKSHCQDRVFDEGHARLSAISIDSRGCDGQRNRI